jgi:poly(3-hydroxybutyrate) depolymerase
MEGIRLTIVVTCVLSSLACSRRAPTMEVEASAAPTTRASDRRVRPSPGCHRRMHHEPARQVFLDVGGVRRSYLLVPPAAYDPDRPYPVVLGFHGSGSRGSEIRDALDLEGPRSSAAIFAYPDGLPVGEGTAWLLDADARDVRFVDALLADVALTFCIDEGAIFAVGYSYGGWMANALACARPRTVRAVVSIEGGGPMTTCSEGVAAMIVHGSGDFVEPIMSGEASRDHWSRANGCRRAPPSASPDPCVPVPGCPSEKPVWWCRHDGDHAIPAFASERAWAFFDSQLPF